MKKLMLAFAVVVIAAVTNAASVNWTASNVYQGWTGGDASAKASPSGNLLLISQQA